MLKHVQQRKNLINDSSVSPFCFPGDEDYRPYQLVRVYFGRLSAPWDHPCQTFSPFPFYSSDPRISA
jgi:hypothetical protein